MLQRWGGKVGVAAYTEDDFVELRRFLRLFGDKNMTVNQRKSLYDPKFRETFLRKFGSDDMTEKQRKGQFSGDGEGLTEKQRMGRFNKKLAEPILGQHAKDREHMGFIKKKNFKHCYICLYTMFMVPKFRDEADVQYKIYHQTNPPSRNEDGTKNKDYVNPSKYALRSTYSNDQKMINKSTGGCNACNIWVCDTCWQNFDHNQAQKYVQFKLTRPNYSDFGKQLYYGGHCEKCDHDMYTASQYFERNQRCKTCSGPYTSRPWVNRNIRSKLGELCSEAKRKKCKCIKDCECTE